MWYGLLANGELICVEFFHKEPYSYLEFDYYYKPKTKYEIVKLKINIL